MKKLGYIILSIVFAALLFAAVIGVILLASKYHQTFAVMFLLSLFTMLCIAIYKLITIN